MGAFYAKDYIPGQSSAGVIYIRVENDVAEADLKW